MSKTTEIKVVLNPRGYRKEEFKFLKNMFGNKKVKMYAEDTFYGETYINVIHQELERLLSGMKGEEAWMSYIKEQGSNEYYVYFYVEKELDGPYEGRLSTRKGISAFTWDYIKKSKKYKQTAALTFNVGGKELDVKERAAVEDIDALAKKIIEQDKTKTFVIDDLQKLNGMLMMYKGEKQLLSKLGVTFKKMMRISPDKSKNGNDIVEAIKELKRTYKNLSHNF